jgi:hypothetical protein
MRRESKRSSPLFSLRGCEAPTRGGVGFLWPFSNAGRRILALSNSAKQQNFDGKNKISQRKLVVVKNPTGLD